MLSPQWWLVQLKKRHYTEMGNQMPPWYSYYLQIHHRLYFLLPPAPVYKSESNPSLSTKSQYMLGRAYWCNYEWLLWSRKKGYQHDGVQLVAIGLTLLSTKPFLLLLSDLWSALGRERSKCQRCWCVRGTKLIWQSVLTPPLRHPHRLVGWLTCLGCMDILWSVDQTLARRLRNCRHLGKWCECAIHLLWRTEAPIVSC